MNYPSCRVWSRMIEYECFSCTPNNSWNGSYYYVGYPVCIPPLLDIDEDESREKWHNWLKKLRKRMEGTDHHYVSKNWFYRTCHVDF